MRKAQGSLEYLFILTAVFILLILILSYVFPMKGKLVGDAYNTENNVYSRVRDKIINSTDQ